VSLGRCTREVARAKADEIAARFLSVDGEPKLEVVTLKALFDIYGREVSPHKGDSKRRHDQRCAKMFLRFFGAGRDACTLSRREWDRFVVERRRGAIAPTRPGKGRAVRHRMIGYDLSYLRTVLNWATVASDERGGVLLERNPLKGLPLPTEESPTRSVLTAEQYEALRFNARSWATTSSSCWLSHMRPNTGSDPCAGFVGQISISIARQSGGAPSTTRSVLRTRRRCRKRQSNSSRVRASDKPRLAMPGCSHRRPTAASHARGTERVISSSDFVIERNSRRANATGGIRYVASSPAS
jgi:hypothetical protein